MTTLSFRRKIFLSHFILLIVFIAALFPFVEKTVTKILHRAFKDTTEVLIEKITTGTHTEEEMINSLRAEEFFVFFRVSLLNEKGELLYDSLLPRRLGDKFVPFYPSSHPEVIDAMKKGVGYYEGDSQVLTQKFSYVAVSFHFADKKYVLRSAFPYSQVQELTDNFRLGFFILATILLAAFSVTIVLIFYRFSRPMSQIVSAVKSHKIQEGQPIFEIALSPSVSKDDDFNKLASTLNSLSEKIQAQIKNLVEERNEKEAILESLGEGVIAVDKALQITYINFVGSKMLGAPKRYLTRKSLFELQEKISVPLLEKCRDLLQACQEQNMAVTDSYSTGEGKKQYLDLIAAPKAFGNGAIVVLQDKSSHYKVLEMGKDFVANASHELRTPITIIKGFAETLQDLPEITTEMLADITEKIVRNCQRMDSLVKNLLTLADIENLPESRFRECDLFSLLENCVDLLLSVHPETLVTLEQSTRDIIISADIDILELALMNILENAVKYSHPPAHITINLEDLDEEVKLIISDKGIGIPAADIDHIFERFYTVNKAHSRRLGGAGLGLSLVKTIIEKHDGTITVTSTLGQGTIFTIILPKFRWPIH